MAESVGNAGTGMKLHTKILLGLLIGAILGITANQTLGGAHSLVEAANKYLAGPVGQIFLRLLFMIVIPLVFASISLGVAGLGDLRRVGRVGAKAISYFLLSTALAATLGLVVVSVVRPGEQLDPAVRQELLQTYAGDAASRVQASQQTNFGVETLVNIVTRNPIKSAADLDMLGIIFFGLIFGAALTLIKEERARPMIGFLQALNDVVIKIVEMAMRLAPYGVAALIFGVTSRFGFHLLKPLGLYVASVLGALLLHLFGSVSAIVRVLVGLSPRRFFSRIRAALVTAFSTSSSSATLPTALATAEQNLGIPLQIAGFVLPLGSTMCMNGTALFEGMTVIFLAQVFGVELGLGKMVVVMIMAVLTAVGAAGVPGGSIPLLVGILAMFGVPPEGIAIVLGVDRILDMTRTMVNVGGDLTATAFVARSERVWSPSDVPEVEGLDRAGRDESPDPGYRIQDSGSGIQAAGSEGEPPAPIEPPPGPDLNAVDEQGNTALIEAADSGNFEAVRRLVQQGANLNTVSAGGRSALMCAVKRGHADIVDFLLTYGADPNLSDRDGTTTLGLAELAPSAARNRILQALRRAGAG